MLGEVLLNKDLPIYEYQNTKLTVNDQTWIGGIAGLCNLERRRSHQANLTALGRFQEKTVSSSWFLGVLPEGENPKPVGLLSV